MKRIHTLLLVLLISAAFAASAQTFRVGITAGAALNSVSDKFDYARMRSGAAFTGGATFEANMPMLGFGFDLSMLYERRKVKFDDYAHFVPDEICSTNPTFGRPRSRSYITIPLNIKWKLGLPLFGDVLKPFIATGPSIALLVGHREDYDNKRIWSWNLGCGIELLRRLQLRANYAIPLSRSYTIAPSDQFKTSYKDHLWTFTATFFLAPAGFFVPLKQV